jgi:hypothetical protein
MLISSFPSRRKHQNITVVLPTMMLFCVFVRNRPVSALLASTLGPCGSVAANRAVSFHFPDSSALQPCPLIPYRYARGNQGLFLRSFSTSHSEEDQDGGDYRYDDEDDDDGGSPSTERPSKLEALKLKSYDMAYLKELKERGDILLQPFYQRDYKWKQQQASVWIESILYGYPCIPHIILLTTIDEDGDEKYAVFDGQQRLTSTMLYMSNTRGPRWPAQRGNDDDSFRLLKLPKLKSFEGMSYPDLTKKQQNEINKFEVNCAIIPSSWSMENYIDFFKRIQGGGTPMTDQELRRALSQGPFTDLLDNLTKNEVVQKALDGCKELKSDDVQELLLRYFQYRIDSAKFGKPSLAQRGLETMKLLNREMKSWSGEEFYKQEDLVVPLKKSFELIILIFNHGEAFRRPVPLVKGDEPIGVHDLKKVWVDQTKLRPPIFDCTVAAFAREDVLAKEKAIRQNAGEIRTALISLMQTHYLFTDTLRSSDISSRVQLFATEILAIIEASPTRSGARVGIPYQQRKELIKSAITSDLSCKICGQSLGPFDDHLHIDHIFPVSKGGTNALNNLQVVHKTCNLMKSDKVSDQAEGRERNGEDGFLENFWKGKK